MNTFSKAEFKKEVNDYVKVLSRKTLDEASQLDKYQGVAYALKDYIIDQWIATHKEYEKKDAKTVYYLSMEFLMGRALGNIIINLSARQEIKEAIEELDIAIRLSKNPIKMKFDLAGLYCSANQWIEASKVLEEILEESPDYIDAILGSFTGRVIPPLMFLKICLRLTKPKLNMLRFLITILRTLLLMNVSPDFMNLQTRFTKQKTNT